MDREIKLYTWAHCPYCNNAKRLLKAKGLAYTDIDIYQDEKMRRQLEQQTGQRTVPFVFIGETFIGGFSELQAIDASGQLDKLLG
jgi:glutaredoxin 3